MSPVHHRTVTVDGHEIPGSPCGAATTRSSVRRVPGPSPGTPDAEVRLIDGGHFLLESHLHVVAGYLRGFLGRVPA